MTETTKMVDLPWVDGTTRTVPEWTLYTVASGSLFTARDGGYSPAHDPSKSWGRTIYPHVPDSAAVRIFTEAPEPPVKVNVPTGLGAIVSLPTLPTDPGYVLTQEGWIGLRTRREYSPDWIDFELRTGARVIFEGAGGGEN